jgi:16S rRNA (guanine527-N7)-methyltransferase
VAKVIHIEAGMQVIDIGTGAGFPGLPLHIVFTDLKTTLLESTGKKVRFLDHLIAALKLQGVRAVQMRAEEAGQDTEHRGRYDLVLARAVARLPALAEYMLPLAKIGGQCVAMKGETARQEVDDALNAIEILGGGVKTIEAVQLPGVDDTHYLIVIEKLAQTPKAYPRNPGTPTRKPLM